MQPLHDINNVARFQSHDVLHTRHCERDGPSQGIMSEMHNISKDIFTNLICSQIMMLSEIYVLLMIQIVQLDMIF